MVAEEVQISHSQEAEAIQKAQRGDHDAFAQIYRLHSSRVFALCLRMLKNSAEAEDLTQEAFLAIFRAIHTFRGQAAFSTWLHRVTMNCVLMHLRKKAVPAVSLEEVIQTDRESKSLPKEPSHRDLRLEGLSDRLPINRAIAQLPARLKHTFMLYDLWGYEHKEIARMLACSVGTSKSQLHKARRRLRDLLPKYPVATARLQAQFLN